MLNVTWLATICALVGFSAPIESSYAARFAFRRAPNQGSWRRLGRQDEKTSEPSQLQHTGESTESGTGSTSPTEIMDPLIGPSESDGDSVRESPSSDFVDSAAKWLTLRYLKNRFHGLREDTQEEIRQGIGFAQLGEWDAYDTKDIQYLSSTLTRLEQADQLAANLEARFNVLPESSKDRLKQQLQQDPVQEISQEGGNFDMFVMQRVSELLSSEEAGIEATRSGIRINRGIYELSEADLSPASDLLADAEIEQLHNRRYYEGNDAQALSPRGDQNSTSTSSKILMCLGIFSVCYLGANEGLKADPNFADNAGRIAMPFLNMVR